MSWTSHNLSRIHFYNYDCILVLFHTEGWFGNKIKWCACKPGYYVCYLRLDEWSWPSMICMTVVYLAKATLERKYWNDATYLDNMWPIESPEQIISGKLNVWVSWYVADVFMYNCVCNYFDSQPLYKSDLNLMVIQYIFQLHQNVTKGLLK